MPRVRTMSLLDILFKILAFGVFLFSFKLAFPRLGNVEFSWFSWKDARLLILFLYFYFPEFFKVNTTDGSQSAALRTQDAPAALALL